VALDLPDRHTSGVQRDDLVVETIQARLALGHDLRLEAAVAITRHLDLDRPVLGQHRLGGGPVAVVARPPAGGIALLVAEMVRQLGAQRTLEQRLLELLEKAILAQKVLRLLVAGQKLVKMFWLDWHRVVSFVRLTTVPSHTIFLTLPRGRAVHRTARQSDRHLRRREAVDPGAGAGAGLSEAAQRADADRP